MNGHFSTKELPIFTGRGRRISLSVLGKLSRDLLLSAFSTPRELSPYNGNDCQGMSLWGGSAAGTWS